MLVTTRLRALLGRPETAIIMEAHNGLSARLVTEAGFEAIWASSLAVSASLGLRDCNEASWTQVLDVIEFMVDAAGIPVLVDGDTGFGNFNNARRLVRKLEQRNAAGVCIEDKLFPKLNSFAGGVQPLAEVGEFCGRIRAAKDTQTDADFVVVARTEALVVQRSVGEALERAARFAEAGADAMFVHSRSTDAAAVVAFLRQWPGTVPIVLCPTSYAAVDLGYLASLGATTFIFGNHSLRTVIRALQVTLAELKRTSSIQSVEGSLASLDEVFRLQDMAELMRAEQRYQPRTGRNAVCAGPYVESYVGTGDQ